MATRTDVREDRLTETWQLGQPADAYPPAGYAWLALTLLFLCAVLSYTDRLALNLLVDPMRRDLAISDTGVSLLQGAAFVVIYAVIGLPLGRYADNHNRRNLIVLGIIVWSVCTGLCAFAGSFTQLFLARIGVGLGEAALAPAAISMLSDYFPPHRRATAIALFLSGMVAGAGVANIVGGLLLGALQSGWLSALPVVGEIAPWRATLLLLSLPGVPLVALLLLVREPLRRERLMQADSVPIAACLAYLKANSRTFMFALGGLALVQLVDYGVNAWLPTLLIRRFAMMPAEVGGNIGVIAIICSLLGAFGGGIAADRLQQRGYADGKLRLAAIGVVLLPPLICFPLFASSTAVLAGFAAYTLIFSSLGATGIAAMQDVAPSEMRGLVVSLQAFLYTLLGLGGGPTLVALVSDRIARDGERIGTAMAVVGLAAAFASAVLIWCGLPAYRATREKLARRSLAAKGTSS